MYIYMNNVYVYICIIYYIYYIIILLYIILYFYNIEINFVMLDEMENKC